MPLIQVLIGDGNMPIGTRYQAITKYSEKTGSAESSANCTGFRSNFASSIPFFGYYDWDVDTTCSACKSFGYLFKKLKADKSITEDLERRVARFIGPQPEDTTTDPITPPGGGAGNPPPPPPPPPRLPLVDPVPIDPINPPPPPPSGRVLAIYKEEGVPKADVAWTAGSESGVTNSLGEVRINDLGPVSLAMGSFAISQFIDDEQVEINVSNIYED